MLAGQPPAAADLPALRHTTMAIKEAMRLYPPAYALGRRAEAQTEIGGHVIPTGSDVLVSQYATHRHPQFWPDAETFDPSRFTPEREQARHPHAYFPFGTGPRACIGSQFAMLEAVTAAAACCSTATCAASSPISPSTPRESHCGRRAPCRSSRRGADRSPRDRGQP